MPEIIDFICSHGLEILGFCVGILYLWWEYHADNRVWLASVVMPGISLWIYFSKGLYADFGINIYYLVMAVYGYARWTSGRGTRSKTSLPVTHIPGWGIMVSVVASLLLWAALAWILMTFTDSNVPYADAFTTALSIVGTWMLARKWAEQWIVWLVVDAVCVGLYIYKGLVFYPILYGIYTVISLFGYRKWLRMIKAPAS